MFEFFLFFLTFAALVLLILVSVSTPVVKQLYFLHTSQAGGVQFGEWGWCYVDGTRCSGKALGIDWEPELISWLTKALVLFPIAAGITFISLLSFVPPLWLRYRYYYFPTPAVTFFAFASFLTSALALTFSLILFVTGLKRFHDGGYEADLGPCMWMAIGATAALTIVTMSSGCGCTGSRGRFTRASPYLAYDV